ncbi:MAG: hypothetical protein ABIC96_02985 [Patescibacteria group bacterium]
MDDPNQGGIPTDPNQGGQPAGTPVADPNAVPTAPGETPVAPEVPGEPTVTPEPGVGDQNQGGPTAPAV